MFGSKPRVKTTIDSLIGATTRMEGTVVFHGGLRIDGHVRGDVLAAGDAPGLLVIGENGRVEGDIVAAHVVVSGTVAGSISGSELVELHARARVSGQVRYKTLEVQRGATIEAALAPMAGESPKPGLKLAPSPEAASARVKAEQRQIPQRAMLSAGSPSS